MLLHLERERQKLKEREKEMESGFNLGIYHRYRQPLICHCAPADTGSGSSIFSWRVNDWPLPRTTAPEESWEASIHDRTRI